MLINKGNIYVLSQRLQAKVIKIVDVSYGGENGFNQAIELAAESLANVKFIQEKKLIGECFEPIVLMISLGNISCKNVMWLLV